MYRRLPKLFVALALTCSIGLHWPILQSVAWTTMLVGNLQSLSLSQAVVRTFDGKHPCALCKGIAKGKKSEQRSEFPSQIKKFEFLVAQGRFIFSAPSRCWVLTTGQEPLESVFFSPPTPPPREILV